MPCVLVCVHFSTLLLLLPPRLVSLTPSSRSRPRDVESSHSLASFTIMALMSFRFPHGDFSTFLPNQPEAVLECLQAQAIKQTDKQTNTQTLSIPRVYVRALDWLNCSFGASSGRCPSEGFPVIYSRNRGQN